VCIEDGVKGKKSAEKMEKILQWIHLYGSGFYQSAALIIQHLHIYF
jgi:hypothetical protein